MILLYVPETYFSVSEELVLFAYSCLLGAVIGVWYDLFRIIRLLLPHNFFLVAAEDIVFLGGSAAAVCCFTSAAVRSELHGWYVLGAAIGFTLYLLTLGSFVMRFARKLLTLVRTLLSLLLSPVRKAFVLFSQAIYRKFVGCSKVFVQYVKKALKHLKINRKMLYNRRESKIRRNVDNVVRKD